MPFALLILILFSFSGPHVYLHSSQEVLSQDLTKSEDQVEGEKLIARIVNEVDALSFYSLLFTLPTTEAFTLGPPENGCPTSPLFMV